MFGTGGVSVISGAMGRAGLNMQKGRFGKLSA